MIALKDIRAAFFLLHDELYKKDFTKTQEFRTIGEKQFLLPVRFYLLGCFGKVSPEKAAVSSSQIEFKGRYDFLINDIAIELAVRKLNEGKSCLMPLRNGSEISKLLHYEGLSILVLFDLFTDSPLDEQDLASYRKHNLNAKSDQRGSYHIQYLFRKDGETQERNLRISF